MMMAGAVVGVASGQPAPGTPQNPIVFGAHTTSGSVWVPLTPNRVLDTRINLGLTGKLHSKVARTFQVTGLHPLGDTINVPAEAVGITGNLTVDKQTASGYFS